MNKEQLEKANHLERQMKAIESSLKQLGGEMGRGYELSEKCLCPMVGVLRGFFDEDVYRLRAEAYLADLRKQMDAL